MKQLVLKGTCDNYFAIRIVGYQFPKALEDYDANWVVVQVAYRDGGAEWTASCPCMLSWELKWAAQWFVSILEGTCCEDTMPLMESDLSLEYSSSRSRLPTLVVRLQHGLSVHQNVTSPIELSFDVTRDELQAGKPFFEAAFDTFPPRGAIGRHWSSWARRIE